MPKSKSISADVRVSPPSTRYTLDGDARVEARIDADQRLVAAEVAEVVPASQLVAVVLMGGYGRGEGGYIEMATDAGPQPAPYNDYDYFVVIRRAGRQQRGVLAKRLAGAAQRLEAKVGVEVDFALLRHSRLRRAERSLMNAEMRWGHRVISGDPSVLSRLPSMPFTRLAPGEITRLMLNRGALLLLNQQRLSGHGGRWMAPDQAVELDPTQREVFFKYLAKALLACGDARLAMSGCYHPSYPVKLGRLEGLAPPAPWAELLGNDHAAFLELYRFAYRNKFRPNYTALMQESVTDWQGRVRRLWLTTFSAFESWRLGAPIKHWTDYCQAEVPKGQAAGRGGALRCLAITLRDFGAGEVFRSLRRSVRYPRERLVATLPMLLSDVGERPDPCVLSALGLPANSRWKQATETFLRYWGRYA